MFSYAILFMLWSLPHIEVCTHKGKPPEVYPTTLARNARSNARGAAGTLFADHRQVDNCIQSLPSESDIERSS